MMTSVHFAAILLNGGIIAFLLSRRKVDGIEFGLWCTFIMVTLVPSILLTVLVDVRYTFIGLAYFAVFYILSKAFKLRIFSYSSWRYIYTPRQSRLMLAYWIACLLVAGVAAVTGGKNGEGLITGIAFTGSMAASYPLYAKLIDPRKRGTALIMFSGYVITVALYAAYSWNGFGRILLAAYIFAPVIIAVQCKVLPLKLWQVLIIAPLMIYLAYVSRMGVDRNFRTIETDSIGADQVVTLEMYDDLPIRSARPLREYIGQMALLPFQWVPREIWPSKPVGIGRGYVDEWMGDEGVSSAHSVAMGFMGEQLWYLNYAAPIGLFAYLLLFIALRVLVFRAGYREIASIAAFDANIASFVWGGGASFSGRVWPFVFASIAATLLLHLFFRSPRRRDGIKTPRLNEGPRHRSIEQVFNARKNTLR